MKRKLVKKSLLFILFFMLSFLFVIQIDTTSLKAVTLLEEYENLYYGYDVTSGKSLLESDSLQRNYPIIDPNSNYSDYIVIKSGSEQDANNYVGSSMKEISEQYVTGIGASIYGKIAMVSADVESAFDTSNAIANRYSENYELYDMSIERYHYLVQNLELSEIRDFLSQKFVADLNSVDGPTAAKNLFKKYGTHLNTGYTMGGRMLISNYQTTTDTKHNYNNSISLKEKLSVMTELISKASGGQSFSLYSQYGNAENTSNFSSSYDFKSYGGFPTSAFTVDHLFTYASSWNGVDTAGYLYTVWVNSIGKNENLAIIGIPNGAGAIPLWNLLPNTGENAQKRQWLLEAFIEMCGDKYDAYLKEYALLERNYAEGVETDGITSTVNGAFLRTPNNYAYYVNAEDLTSTGDHNQVHIGEVLYMDLTEYTVNENITYLCQGCEIVDKKNGIFRVTGTGGNCKITAYYDEDKKVSSVILNVPIANSYFEGGVGNEKYPYIIANDNDFENISYDTSAHYMLFNDIDFNNQEISQFGSFSGVLDGNYCTLKNFTIKNSDQWGLFKSNSGTIKNLKIQNAGSSTDYTSFAEGKITNYADIYTDESFTKNSISATNAGLLCAINTGKISNCYLENTYIRNIIRDKSGTYYVNNEFTMTTGGLVGINNGTIENSMVYNSNLLGSFIYLGEKNQAKSYVYSGGLVGELKGGTIYSCIVDNGSTGTIHSQNVSNNKASKGNSVMLVFSGGMVGFCDSTAKLENNYVYNRGDLAINVSYKWHGGDTKLRYKLRNTYMIIGPNAKITSINNYAYSAETAQNFTYDAINMLTKESGQLNNDSDSDYTLSKLIEELKVDGISDFNKIKLTNPYFNYNRSGDANPSKVHHLMAQSKDKYISASLETTNKIVKTDFYQNESFTLKDLEITRNIGGSIAENCKIFKIQLINDSGADVLESKLSSLGSGNYSLNIYLYNNDTVKVTSIPNVVVKENSLVSIFVDENDESLYTIYYDDINSYKDNFGFSKINLKGVLTNGEVVSLDENSTYLSKAKLSYTTVSLGLGVNVVYIVYGNNSKTFTTSYKLYVEERVVEGLKVLKGPDETSFNAGSDLNITGLEIQVTYEDGSTYIIKDKNLNLLEIIGGQVSVGKNTYAVSYQGYNNLAYFDIDGVPARYTIVFKDYDGKILNESVYYENQSIITPNAPSRSNDNLYEYTFTGWDKDITVAKKDVVYTATYKETLINYQVTFKNWNGAVLSTNTYHYGEKIEVPANPTRPNDGTHIYTFTGWDITPSSTCSGNAVYTAVYSTEMIEYKVTFKNWDGTILSEKTYHYGDTIVIPNDPTKRDDKVATYTFAGWDKTPTSVCYGNAEYTAIYNDSKIDYTIQFKDWDGTIISTKTYNYGDKIILPTDPVKSNDNKYSYTFAGWDKTPSTCTNNETYIATYTQKLIDYTVKFKNWDGTIISTKTYNYGDEIVVPSNPTRESDKKYNYKFIGWNIDLEHNCVGNAEYLAVYETSLIEYEVVFKNWDNTIISNKIYNYGDKIVIPGNPEKLSDEKYDYTFTGWDKEIDLTCTQNIEYKATYKATLIDYVIIFKNWDGSVISTNIYNYGDVIVIPATPTRPNDDENTYIFAGWDVTPLITCQGNEIYIATYSANGVEQTYNVVFKNWDGSIISSNTYKYGETIDVPSNPERPNEGATQYEFIGWNLTPSILCLGNAEYIAQFKVLIQEQKFEVTFKNWDGSIISTAIYSLGEQINVPNDPTKLGDKTYYYTFAGWDKNVSDTCTADAVYVAIFTQSYVEYVVTFKNWDGSVISQKTYHYGDYISFPAEPTREADDKFEYTFKCWNTGNTIVIENMEIIAQYTQIEITTNVDDFSCYGFNIISFFNMLGMLALIIVIRKLFIHHK